METERIFATLKVDTYTFDKMMIKIHSIKANRYNELYIFLSWISTFILLRYIVSQ